MPRTDLVTASHTRTRTRRKLKSQQSVDVETHFWGCLAEGEYSGASGSQGKSSLSCHRKQASWEVGRRAGHTVASRETGHGFSLLLSRHHEWLFGFGGRSTSFSRMIPWKSRAMRPPCMSTSRWVKRKSGHLYTRHYLSTWAD